MPNLIKIKLSNGDEAHLDTSEGVSSGTEMALAALKAADADGWLRTREETVVHRSHVAEAWLVIDADEPKRRGERVGDKSR